MCDLGKTVYVNTNLIYNPSVSSIPIKSIDNYINICILNIADNTICAISH